MELLASSQFPLVSVVTAIFAAYTSAPLLNRLNWRVLYFISAVLCLFTLGLLFLDLSLAPLIVNARVIVYLVIGVFIFFLMTQRLGDLFMGEQTYHGGVFLRKSMPFGAHPYKYFLYIHGKGKKFRRFRCTRIFAELCMSDIEHRNEGWYSLGQKEVQYLWLSRKVLDIR